MSCCLCPARMVHAAGPVDSDIGLPTKLRLLDWPNQGKSSFVFAYLIMV
jgi:hypothetical protein